MNAMLKQSRRLRLWDLDTHIDGEVKLKKVLKVKELKRGEAPLRNSLPSPFMKGRGIKGEGLVKTISYS